MKASECSRSRTYIPIPTRLPHRTGRSSAVRNGGRSTSGPDRDYKWATPRDRSRRGTRKGRSARRNEPVRLPWAEILQRAPFKRSGALPKKRESRRRCGARPTASDRTLETAASIRTDFGLPPIGPLRCGRLRISGVGKQRRKSWPACAEVGPRKSALLTARFHPVAYRVGPIRRRSAPTPPSARWMSWAKPPNRTRSVTSARTPARGAEAVMRGRLGGTRGRRGKSRRKQRTFRAPRYIDLLHAWRESPAEREFRRAHEMCADEGKRFARHAGGGPARRPCRRPQSLASRFLVDACA